MTGYNQVARIHAEQRRSWGDSVGAYASPVIRRHLAWLEQKGRAATTGYDRERILVRLEAWFAEYDGGPRPGAEDRRPSQGKPVVPDGPGLLDASAAALAAWRGSLTIGPGAVCSYVSHVRCFYDWALREGLVTVNPALGLPVPRRPKRLPRPIPDDDLMRALDHAPPRIRPWLILAGWAGLRAKEIALLRAENLILAGPNPHILVASDATKGTRERIVPLHPWAAAELAAHGIPAKGWVFPRVDGKPGPNKPYVVSHDACSFLHEQGISHTLHTLRHRFLTQAQWQGGDLRETQALAGHADPGSTAGYTMLAPGRAAEIVSAIPAPAARLRVVNGLNE